MFTNVLSRMFEFHIGIQNSFLYLPIDKNLWIILHTPINNELHSKKNSLTVKVIHKVHYEFNYKNIEKPNNSGIAMKEII